MEMESFKEQLRSVVKEGTDFAQIETALNELNPLSGLRTKEDAWKLATSNQLLMSAFDSKLTERQRTIEENLMNGKVKDIIAQKEKELRSQLAPQETEEQKRIRELEKSLQERDKREATIALQDKLSEKAKALGFDPIAARKFSAFGDQAEAELEAFAGMFNTSIEERVSALAKEKFTTGSPKVKVPDGGLGSLSDEELNRLSIAKPEMTSEILKEISSRMGKLKRT